MMIERYFGIDHEIAQQRIAATESMNSEKSGDNGFQNTRVFIFSDYAVLKMQNMNFRNVTNHDPDLKHLERLAITLLDLLVQGVNVVPILAFQSNDGNGCIIQSRAKGAELYDRDRASDRDYIMERVELLSNAPQKHFDKFVADVIKIMDAGVIVDFVGKDNFFYDETVGFQFIDLNAHYDYEYGIGEKPSDEIIKQIAAYNCFLPCYFDTVPQHRDTVSKIMGEFTAEERSLLKERNRVIFEKCKVSLLNNGISESLISEIISNERFIPQKQQVGLKGEEAT